MLKKSAIEIYDIIDMESKIDPYTDEGVKVKAENFTGAIEFKNIKFKYPSADTEVIKNLNLKIEAGK